MSLYQAICFLVSHFIYRSAWHISPSASDKTLSHIQKIRTGNINENWKLPPHLKTWLEEHSRTVTLPMRPFRRYEKNNWQLEGRNSKSQVQSLSSPNDKYHNLPATQKREWWDSKHLLVEGFDSLENICEEQHSIKSSSLHWLCKVFQDFFAYLLSSFCLHLTTRSQSILQCVRGT